MGWPWDIRVCMAAVQNGDMDLLQWAVGQGCPWDYERLVTAAAGRDRVEMLKWAVANGCPQ